MAVIIEASFIPPSIHFLSTLTSLLLAKWYFIVKNRTKSFQCNLIKQILYTTNTNAILLLFRSVLFLFFSKAAVLYQPQ